LVDGGGGVPDDMNFGASPIIATMIAAIAATIAAMTVGLRHPFGAGVSSMRPISPEKHMFREIQQNNDISV
jgi:hypothetical protein